MKQKTLYAYYKHWEKKSVTKKVQKVQEFFNINF